MDLTANRLRELLHYEPETGVFVRLVRTTNAVRVGDVAGSLGSHGYLQVMVDGRLYLAHRLAWLYVTGFWPRDQVDHRDRDRRNNAFANLRDVTRSVNSQNVCSPRSNNRSGILGVAFHKAKARWTAAIDGDCLGYFDDSGAAATAYRAAKVARHEGSPDLHTLSNS